MRTEGGTHDAAKIRVAMSPVIAGLLKTEAKARLAQVTNATAIAKAQHLNGRPPKAPHIANGRAAASATSHSSLTLEATTKKPPTRSRMEAPNMIGYHHDQGPPFTVWSIAYKTR